ncbi:hypothetical protein GCM10027570_23390 [Streptomonospora sediminis]
MNVKNTTEPISGLWVYGRVRENVGFCELNGLLWRLWRHARYAKISPAFMKKIYRISRRCGAAEHRPAARRPAARGQAGPCGPAGPEKTRPGPVKDAARR